MECSYRFLLHQIILRHLRLEVLSPNHVLTAFRTAWFRGVLRKQSNFESAQASK